MTIYPDFFLSLHIIGVYSSFQLLLFFYKIHLTTVKTNNNNLSFVRCNWMGSSMTFRAAAYLSLRLNLRLRLNQEMCIKLSKRFCLIEFQFRYTCFIGLTIIIIIIIIIKNVYKDKNYASNILHSNTLFSRHSLSNGSSWDLHNVIGSI